MSNQVGGVIPCTARLEHISERLVGGKAWNLFHLRRFGFPVPRWWVVSSTVFDEACSPLRGSIVGILSTIDFRNQASLDGASARLRSLVLEAESPKEFQRELAETVFSMSEEKGLFSVRSSVVGEDSVKHSFAGLMDSFLSVSIGAVLKAVREVWASSFSSRALSYRHKMGIGFAEISAAVIIQEMVSADSSGILFTIDPETREATCIISAGYGLGEGVVSNVVETDTYRIGHDLGHICKDVPVKAKRVILCAKDGTRTEALPVVLRTQQVLTDQQIRKLGAAGTKAEKCFGRPQDIEWAFDGDGKLHILQARPIVMQGLTASGPVRIWDNSNIIEGYPGVTLPLTFSFIRKAYEHLFRNVTLSFLLLKKDIQKDLPIFENMVGLIHGRVYYNLLNWYRMMSYLPGYEKYKEAWDKMIGINEKVEFPQSHLRLANRLYGLLAAAWRLLGTQRSARSFYAVFRPVYERYGSADFSLAAEETITAVYRCLKEDLIDRWHLTLFNDFCAIRYFDWLQKICSNWGPEGQSNLHNDLVCGEHGVESVAPIHFLVRIAERVRSDPALRELFDLGDDEKVWERMGSKSSYRSLKEQLETYLMAYGDRGVEELKLEKPSFRDQPSSLVGMIRSYCRLRLSVEAMEGQNRETREKAEAVMRESLKGHPLRQMLFWFVLRNARRAIANRENMRFERSRLYGIVRRLFQRMGQLFAQKGLLDQASDIFYLTVEEVLGYMEGAAVTLNLKALVDLRKMEYAGFERHRLKDRIYTKGNPYRNLDDELETARTGGNMLQGIGCSSGVAKGVARIVLSPSSASPGGDYILVARSTDPGWVFLMVSCKGVVVERGSPLSHTAIIGRELGIPTIVGVKEATRLIPDGASLTIDGGTGVIQWR